MEKKYKKALLKAREAKQNTESAVTIGILEEIFPELKESEDERIRKEIIDFIDTNTIGSDERRNRWFSYLEKQGEKSQRIISAEAKEALYNKPAWSEEDEGIDNIPPESSVNYVVTNSNKKQGEWTCTNNGLTDKFKTNKET